MLVEKENRVLVLELSCSESLRQYESVLTVELRMKKEPKRRSPKARGKISEVMPAPERAHWIKMNSEEMYPIKISQTFATLRLASYVRSSVRVCGRSVGFIHVPSLPRHVPSGFRTCHVSLQCCSITPSVSRPRWLRIRCGEASDGFRINGTRKSYVVRHSIFGRCRRDNNRRGRRKQWLPQYRQAERATGN